MWDHYEQRSSGMHITCIDHSHSHLKVIHGKPIQQSSYLTFLTDNVGKLHMASWIPKIDN